MAHKGYNPRSDCFVLDAYAALALLQKEAGGPIVDSLLKRGRAGECRLAMSVVSLGEVFYVVHGNRGPVEAYGALAYLRSQPVELIAANQKLALRAAAVKATKGIGYADSYVVAAAMSQNGRIVTGDSDFRRTEDIVKVRWLP